MIWNSNPSYLLEQRAIDAFKEQERPTTGIHPESIADLTPEELDRVRQVAGADNSPLLSPAEISAIDPRWVLSAHPDMVALANNLASGSGAERRLSEGLTSSSRQTEQQILDAFARTISPGIDPSQPELYKVEYSVSGDGGTARIAIIENSTGETVANGSLNSHSHLLGASDQELYTELQNRLSSGEYKSLSGGGPGASRSEFYRAISSDDGSLSIELVDTFTNSVLKSYPVSLNSSDGTFETVDGLKYDISEIVEFMLVGERRPDPL